MPTDRRTLTGALLFLMIGAIVFFHGLIPLRLPGGDSEIYLSSYGSPFARPRPVYHFREPGAVWMLQFAIAAVPARGGMTTIDRIREGFEHLSTWSGGLFVLLAAVFAIRLTPLPRGRLAAFLLACFGIHIMLFAGHIELYAPLAVSLMLMFLVAHEVFRHNAHPGWLWAAWVLATTIHRVGLFYLPALYFLLPAGARLGPFRRPDRRFAKHACLAILALALPHIAFTLGSALPTRWFNPLAMETYNWMPELLTPFTQAQADFVRANSQLGSFHLFTFGTWDHWRHWFAFLLASAPGLPIVLAFRWRRLAHLDDFQRFLALAAACGWAWAFVWHPHRSFMDWDLFCHPGIASNLFAATLLFGAAPREAVRAPETAPTTPEPDPPCPPAPSEC